MRRYLLASCALALAAGCNGPATTRDLGEASRSLVRIELAYTHVAGGAAAGPAEPRFDAQARFVRYRAFDSASVPTILGIPDFDSVPIDSCRVADGAAELDEALGDDAVARTTDVSLLDAGRLEVRGPVDRAALMPHHYPELVPFVSGVVYGGDNTAPVTLGLGQLYLVSSEGGEEVGAFAAAAVAPRAFPALQPASLDPVRRGGDLDLRWSGDANAMEPLLVEIKWAARGGARAVRCRVRDDGSFSVPREAFDALPAAAQLSSATVTATRLSRGSFAAPGAGRGELDLELRDVAPLGGAP